MTVEVYPSFNIVVWSLSSVKLFIGFLTVNDKLALTPLPSADVAVIVVLPADRQVTFPLPSTFATFVLVEFQFTLLLLASEGETVADIVKFSPMFLVTDTLGFILIPVTFWIFVANELAGDAELPIGVMFPATSKMIA